MNSLIILSSVCAGARPIRPSSFLELQNFANLVNVQCNGDEAFILDCPSSTPGVVVSNTLFPVGVRCDGEYYIAIVVCTTVGSPH